MKRKDKATDEKIEEFRAAAYALFEIMKVGFLSFGLLSADTKTIYSNKYSTKIRIQDAVISFKIKKSGGIKAVVRDAVHGRCKLTLVRRRDILDDSDQALGNLLIDVFFLLTMFCADWEHMMAHLAECRDKGALKAWREGCELYDDVAGRYEGLPHWVKCIRKAYTT